MQIERLYAEGKIVEGDALDRELGEWERYCDYVAELRGER